MDVLGLVYETQVQDLRDLMLTLRVAHQLQGASIGQLTWGRQEIGREFMVQDGGHADRVHGLGLFAGGLEYIPHPDNS